MRTWVEVWVLIDETKTLEDFERLREQIDAELKKRGYRLRAPEHPSETWQMVPYKPEDC